MGGKYQQCIARSLAWEVGEQGKASGGVTHLVLFILQRNAPGNERPNGVTIAIQARLLEANEVILHSAHSDQRSRPLSVATVS